MRGGLYARLSRAFLVISLIYAMNMHNEPAPLPGAQLAAHLGQVAVAGGGGQLDVVARLREAVPGGLDELTQVE